ncbi:MAG TPA: hypothetical protein VMG10_20815 [Gemmataceae bacterium]|nr:hypothetical protein [Gemmataceae bacterium]
MSFFTLFRRPARQGDKSNSRPTHTLYLEALEARDLPSAALPLVPAPVGAVAMAAAQDPTITYSNGSGQSVFIGYSFLSLQARVTDNGQPVAGVPVTFTAPAGGASGFFGLLSSSVTVLTDASGWATAPTFTANGTVGTYTVTAFSTAAGGSASFTLSNLPSSQITFPYGPPTLVQWQLQFDLNTLPSFNTPEGESALPRQLGTWLTFAYLQSPQQATQLFWSEIGLMEGFLLDRGSFYALDRDPRTIYQGLDLITNPLYNTPLGYGTGLLESELILVSVL